MNRPKLIVVIALALGSVAFSGCTKPNPSRQYLDSITVDGYRKVGEGYTNAPAAYFVGPPNEDINSAVHGPGDLRMTKDSVDLSNGRTRHVGSGSAALDGRTCQVLLFRLEPADGSAPYAGDGDLTDEEKAKVMDGSYDLIRVSSLC